MRHGNTTEATLRPLCLPSALLPETERKSTCKVMQLLAEMQMAYARSDFIISYCSNCR